jgi:hypothetical protein
MKYHLDGQDIGMFDQKDLDALQQAFNTLCVQRALPTDDPQAGPLARSLIHLYRHGIRDPRQLVAAVGGDQDNSAVA